MKYTPKTFDDLPSILNTMSYQLKRIADNLDEMNEKAHADEVMSQIKPSKKFKPMDADGMAKSLEELLPNLKT